MTNQKPTPYQDCVMSVGKIKTMNKIKICPYGFHSNQEEQCDCGEKVSIESECSENKDNEKEN